MSFFDDDLLFDEIGTDVYKQLMNIKQECYK